MKFKNDKEGIEALAEANSKLRSEISKVIVGQEQTVQDLLVSIFSKGHCLLVGVPGLAKTLLVQTVSDALGLDFRRIQFTPDLMPGDITGSEILNDQRQFEFVKGPLFTQMLLADEINRTPPKTQAALLEAMQERAVTVSGKRYTLDQPFFVLATQNPIEQEGTYPLPEAQLDRFMFNLELGYPSYEEELDIVKQTTGNQIRKAQPVLNAEEILEFQRVLREIPVPDSVFAYAVQLVGKTRPNQKGASPLANDFLSWGAGPRASQNLILGAKCHAALHGRFSPDKEDVQAIAHAVLRHRIIRNYKAEAEGVSTDFLIAQLF